MPIPALAEFKSQTKNRKLFQNARGPNIGRVDSALERWWKEKNTASAQRQVELLARIVSECSRWLKLKRLSTTASLALRRKACIRTLAQCALDELHRLNYDSPRVSFDRRKIDVLSGHQTDRRVPGQTVPLWRSYAHERSLYLKSHKQTAPSATLFHKYITQGGQHDDRYFEYHRRFGNKRFDQLTEKDFSKLQTLASNGDHDHRVRFLDKNTRLRFWAIPRDHGLLRYEHNGTVVHTDPRYPYTWTMDEYGNLFLAEGEQEEQFNHSSYNAGKDVICGGTIKVTKGKLTYIDNSSGHYKPSEENLVAALQVLWDDGADLKEAKVTVVALVAGRIDQSEKQLMIDGDGQVTLKSGRTNTPNPNR